MTVKLSEFAIEADCCGGSDITHGPCGARAFPYPDDLAEAVAWAEQHDCSDVSPKPEPQSIPESEGSRRIRELYGPMIAHAMNTPLVRFVRDGEP